MHRAMIMTGVMSLAGILALAGPATAQSPSPSPPDGSDSTSLPAGLVTEQVEPGVLRVVSDGHRVLSGERQDDDVFSWGDWRTTHLERAVAAAPDGAVWVFDDSGMFDLGKKKSRSLKGEPPVRSTDDIEIAPDGTMWRVGIPRAGVGTIHSFMGEKWRRDYLPRRMSVFGVELEPNGTAWALWAPPVGADPQGLAPTKLGKWTGKGWEVFDLPKVKASYGRQFAVTGTDDVWICCKDKPWTSEQQRLLHFDGKTFDVVDDPALQPERILSPLLIDGSSDGALWMRRSESVLARHDDDGWTVYTTDDGVPQMGWMPEPTGGFLRAAPEGSVWVSTTLDRGEPPDDWPPACNGIAHFDGTTWTGFLGGMCVFALDVAPDGRAWVQAALPDTATTAEPVPGEPVEPIQTYVIDPDAGEATPVVPSSSPLPSPAE